MIRDITIGQYYPAASPLHRMDPRAKLICTFLFLVSLFLQNNVIVYLMATVFLGTCVYLSKVPLKFIFKGLKAILFLLLFSVAINMFFTSGQPLIRVWIITVTKEGLIIAVFMSIRLIYLIVGSSLMTFVTTPTELTDGLETLFGGLNRIKIPVHEIAMMMSIALRFIPILTEELQKIMKAQEARCADLDSGNLIQKVKGMVPILVPLFISAIRRANDLALAMEARCYRGGEGRTKMKPLRYQSIDLRAFVIAGFYFLMIIAIVIIF